MLCQNRIFEFMLFLVSMQYIQTTAASSKAKDEEMKQMNVSLTGELEDYRTQTRRLLEDLRQKEEEIGELKGALSERGQSSDVSVVSISINVLSSDIDKESLHQYSYAV